VGIALALLVDYYSDQGNQENRRERWLYHITDLLFFEHRSGDKGLDQAKTGPTDSKSSAGKFTQLSLSLAVAVLIFSLF
jgi:hypothetical protein